MRAQKSLESLKMWHCWVSRCCSLNPVHFCTWAEVTLYSSFYVFSFTDSQPFGSNVSTAQGRLALGGPWPFPSHSRQGNPPARLPKLCLPHPACSGETEVTPHPRLSWWGRQHRNGLANGQTHSLCLLQPPNPNFSREDQTQAPNSAHTLQEWGVHRQLAAAESCSSHQNVNVRVRKDNTRWHSYAIEKVHHALPNDKEFRFFSKL